MFESLSSDFDERVAEVEKYFELLRALDNEEVRIAGGIANQVLPVGPLPPECGPMLKAAAYLVLYNFVEAFFRRGFRAVFECVRNDGVAGVDLAEEFRREWIEQKNRRVKPFDGSPKVYMEIAHKIVDESIRRAVVELEVNYLPISGNLDATAAREVFQRHGIELKVSKKARGGRALDTVKRKRNSLAHGDESFGACGGNTTSGELNRAKNEILHFMRGVLNSLKAFSKKKKYKR